MIFLLRKQFGAPLYESWRIWLRIDRFCFILRLRAATRARMTKLITAIPQRLATNHTTYFRTRKAFLTAIPPLNRDKIRHACTAFSSESSARAVASPLFALTLRGLREV